MINPLPKKRRSLATSKSQAALPAASGDNLDKKVSLK